MSTSSQKKQALSLNSSSSSGVLSRLAKGKGLLEDLNSFEMTHYPREIYRNMGQQQPARLFPAMEKPSFAPSATRGFQSVSLLPKRYGIPEKFGSSFPKFSDFSAVEKSLAAEPKKKAPMTIFYDGEVVVLDDYPAEKAKKVMEMAEKLSKMGRVAVAATPVMKKTSTTKLFGVMFPSNSSPETVSAPEFGTNKLGIRQPETFAPTPAYPVMTNIPMQRKASLQRFLEKRKDRMSNVAPYQTVSPGKSPAAADDIKTWLDITDLRSL